MTKPIELANYKVTCCRNKNVHWLSEKGQKIERRIGLGASNNYDDKKRGGGGQHNVHNRMGRMGGGCSVKIG